jgi:hypothetical protein
MMQQGMDGMGLLWMIVLGIVMVVPFWRISQKAGYPGVLALLVLVPLVNLAFFYFLAFARWPIHRQTPPH